MLQEATHNLRVPLDWEKRVERGAPHMEQVSSAVYSEEDIRSGFRHEEGFPGTTLTYRIRMVFASAFALLLPVLVMGGVAFITLSIYRSLWSAAVYEGLSFHVLITLVAAIVLTGFWAAFARRVIFSRRSSKRHLKVTMDAQPELHAFINHVAKLLQGPPPSSVKLDAEVGLAMKPGSLRGAMTGAGPEVIIGLPLLTGLSVRQLAGVIAHAYAGYSQDARLVGYSLLCSMERWVFSQTAAGRARAWARDEFSRQRPSYLERLLAPSDRMVQQVFYWIYRFLTAVTFDIGRQVDMLADAYSARIAGSSEFRSTQFRLRSLSYGQSHAVQELLKSWENTRLCDNFPSLIVEHADTLQLSLRPRLIQEMEELATPLSRSRIVDLGRIVNVEQLQEEGACYLLGSAAGLLRNESELARIVTLSQYEYFGIQAPDLYSALKFQSLRREEREKALLNDVYGGLECSHRVLKVDEFEGLASQSESSLVERLRHERDELAGASDEIRRLADTINEFETRKNLIHARKIFESCLGLEGDAAHALDVEWLSLIRDQSDYKIRLNAFEHRFSRRAALGLALALQHRQVPANLKMERDELYAHMVRLTDALNFLSRSFESVQRLSSYTQILGKLLIEAQPQQAEFEAMAERYQHYLLIEIGALMKGLNGIAYPLRAGVMQWGVDELLTVGDVISHEVIDTQTASTCPEACHRVANSLGHYLSRFNEQLQQRLAQLLITVDRAYGLASESASPR